jgi:hypothetical protein
VSDDQSAPARAVLHVPDGRSDPARAVLRVREGHAGPATAVLHRLEAVSDPETAVLRPTAAVSNPAVAVRRALTARKTPALGSAASRLRTSDVALGSEIPYAATRSGAAVDTTPRRPLRVAAEPDGHDRREAIPRGTDVDDPHPAPETAPGSGRHARGRLRLPGPRRVTCAGRGRESRGRRAGMADGGDVPLRQLPLHQLESAQGSTPSRWSSTTCSSRAARDGCSTWRRDSARITSGTVTARESVGCRCVPASCASRARLTNRARPVLVDVELPPVDGRPHVLAG